MNDYHRYDLIDRTQTDREAWYTIMDRHGHSDDGQVQETSDEELAATAARIQAARDQRRARMERISAEWNRAGMEALERARKEKRQ